MIHLSICLSVYLSIHLSIYLPIYWSTNLSTHLVIHLLACPDIYQPAWVACHIYLVTYLPTQPSIYIPTCPLIYQPTCVASYLSACPPTYLSSHASTHLMTTASTYHQIWFFAKKSMIFSPRPAGARHLFLFIYKKKPPRLISVNIKNATTYFVKHLLRRCWVIGHR